jgi:hypothetical protein
MISRKMKSCSKQPEPSGFLSDFGFRISRFQLRRAAAGALALVVWASGAIRGAAAGDLSVAESSSRPTQWTIEYEGKPVMVYAFDPQKFKPYVKALNTLEGYGVLRDSPSDHLHHHALMYGITVNGINFWEETAGCGVEKVVESPLPILERTAGGLPQARLTQLLYWVAPQDAFLPNSNAPSLLIERRTLVLTLDPGKRETALHWQSAFEVGTRTNVVTLSGANYHGLGMRFLKELDPLAVHLTPEGRLDLANSRQDVSPHPWEAVIFDLPAKLATIALFGAAMNAWSDDHYFAMKTPFAYLAATQNLDREPLTYHRGDHFELNFLITLYPELKTTDALAERSRQWRSPAR